MECTELPSLEPQGGTWYEGKTEGICLGVLHIGGDAQHRSVLFPSAQVPKRHRYLTYCKGSVPGHGAEAPGRTTCQGAQPACRLRSSTCPMSSPRVWAYPRTPAGQSRSALCLGLGTSRHCSPPRRRSCGDCSPPGGREVEPRCRGSFPPSQSHGDASQPASRPRSLARSGLVCPMWIHECVDVVWVQGRRIGGCQRGHRTGQAYPDLIVSRSCLQGFEIEAGGMEVGGKCLASLRGKNSWNSSVYGKPRFAWKRGAADEGA